MSSKVNEEVVTSSDILVTSRYDRLFKTIMIEEKEVLEKIIETVMNKPVEIIEFINQDIPIHKKDEKGKTVDLLLKCDNEYYDVEVNSSTSFATRLRNLNYFFSFISQRTVKGEEYDLKKKFIQINISFAMHEHFSTKTYDIIEEYQFRTSTGKSYYENIRIIEINMDKLMDSWYDKDKLFKEKYKYLIMLDINEREKLKEFCRGDKCMEKYEKKVTELNSNEAFIWPYTREQEMEMIKNTEITMAKEEGMERGTKIGAEQEKINTAKNLLSKGMDIKFIHEITGLSKKQIEELK